MNTNHLRDLRLLIGGAALLLSSPLVVRAQASAQQAKSRTAPVMSNKTQDSLAEIAALKAEDEFFARRVSTLRRSYLRRASWAELGDRCNPGSLRVFPRDTSAATRDSAQKIIESIEQTIIGRGVGGPIDTPDGRALLRVIVGWEAGIDRPNWDSDEKTPRRAIAAGLTGDYPDPKGAGCIGSAAATDTVTVVVPGFKDMIFPNAPKPRIKAYFGPDGVAHARDEYASKHLNDAGATLAYLYVSPFIIWRDYAIVTVTRPLEERGVEINKKNNGGAVYLMHRVAGEWRLLSVVRSWGS